MRQRIVRKKAQSGRTSSATALATRNRGSRGLIASLASEPKQRREVLAARHIFRQAGTPPVAFADNQLQAVVESNPRLSRRVEDLVRHVSFSVALRTPSGERLQEARGHLAERGLDSVRPKADTVHHSEERLRSLGFTIVRRGRFALSVRGPLELVKAVTAADFVVQSRPRFSPSASSRLFADSSPDPGAGDLFLAPSQSLTVHMRGRVAETIDDFVFVPPPLFFGSPSPNPPALGYHSLWPDAIAGLLGVPLGASAQGVEVAVVDTGFADHPYYKNRKFDVSTPASPARTDGHGHGTAVTANVFAVAPDATVSFFSQSDPPQDALETAFDSGARVFSCSWGWDHEQSFPILEATIRDLVSEGAIFLFASGNGHHAWPSTMPDVISVGGVYADAAGAFEASNYASGFLSSLYPNPPRRVPDVCGLCGQAPNGIYIALPCPPGCEMDRRYGGASFPLRDETGKNDGWVVASGTSSATPQVAGVVALLVARARKLGKPYDTNTVRGWLESSARAVTRGRNAFGFPAQGQPNTACGWGLVDAARALALV